AERGVRPIATSAGPTRVASSTYTTVVGMPIPRTIETTITSTSRTITYPPERSTRALASCAPSPVSCTTPTTIPAPAVTAQRIPAASAPCLSTDQTSRGLTLFSSTSTAAAQTPTNAARVAV